MLANLHGIVPINTDVANSRGWDMGGDSHIVKNG
jgi:hypothetical protein